MQGGHVCGGDYEERPHTWPGTTISCSSTCCVSGCRAGSSTPIRLEYSCSTPAAPRDSRLSEKRCGGRGRARASGEREHKVSSAVWRATRQPATAHHSSQTSPCMRASRSATHLCVGGGVLHLEPRVPARLAGQEGGGSGAGGGLDDAQLLRPGQRAQRGRVLHHAQHLRNGGAAEGDRPGCAG